MRQLKFVLAGILLSAFLCLGGSEAQAGIDIISYSYDTEFVAGDTVTCTVTVENTEATTKNPYLLFAVTKSGETTENYGSAVAVPAGGQADLTAAWTAEIGTWTVTMKVYEESFTPILQATEYGSNSIVVAPVASTNISATTLSFPIILGTDKRVLATGYTTVTLQTPVLSGYTFAALRVYTENSSGKLGMTGGTYPEINIPLKVWTANYGIGESGGTPPDINNDIDWKDNIDAVYTLILDKNMYNPVGLDMETSVWDSWPIFEWTDLYKFSDNVTDNEVPAYIDTTYDIYIAADFTNAVAQTYSTSVYFEFIYNNDGSSTGGVSTVSSGVTISATVNPADNLLSLPGIVDFGVLPEGRYMYPLPVEIDWSYNEYAPWYMRVYTDNAARYTGVRGAIEPGSPAGLVSEDGKYTLPLRIWCANFGPELEETGWDADISGPPPVDEDDFWIGPLTGQGRRDQAKAVWLRVPDYMEMGADRYDWRVLMGIDPYDMELATDINPSGDFTLSSPFDIYLATETNARSVSGIYSCDLIIETYSP